MPSTLQHFRGKAEGEKVLQAVSLNSKATKAPAVKREPKAKKATSVAAETTGAEAFKQGITPGELFVTGEVIDQLGGR